MSDAKRYRFEKAPRHHARTVKINLTAKGRALVEELIPLAILYKAAGLRSFDPERIAGLKRDLI